MEHQVYYRPTDLATAHYLEQRLGRQSAYAHSTTLRDGDETSEGRSEQSVPLLTAQEILQLKDEEVIGFHRRLPPFLVNRVDWRRHPILLKRHNLEAPKLSRLGQIADLPEQPVFSVSDEGSDGYIDPDLL